LKGLPHRSATGYGIDLSAGRVTIVRASCARGRVETTVVLDEPLSAPGGTLPSVAAALAKDVERGAAAAACLPAHESFTRWLQTPLSSLSKARKVLPSLLDIQLPFPLESCVYHFPQCRRVEGAKGGAVDALAVAARTQDVAARLELLRQAGLDPERLDHEGIALWTQSLREMPIERESFRTVACVGEDHVALVFGRGTDFRAAHSVRLGLRDLPAGDAAALAPLVQRVRQAVRAQWPEAGGEAAQWVWAGPGAERPDVLEAVRDALAESGPVTFLSHRDPGSFLARALAVRAATAEPLPCNFRTGDLAHPIEARRRERAAARTALLLLAAGLALGAMNGGWRWLLARRMDRVQAAVGEAARGLAGMSRIPRGQEVLVAQRAIEERAGLTAPFLQAFHPPLASLVGDLLAEAREQGIALETLSIRADSATLGGTAGDWNRCEKLAELLRVRGYSASVDRQDAGSDERVHFTIRSSRPEGGPPR
jgi:hypothetical protein